MQPQEYRGYEEEGKEEMSPLTVLTAAPEHIWHWIITCIPFLTVVNGKAKINPAQIIQFLIIAGVGGMVAGYITLTKLEVKFDVFREAVVTEISDLEGEIKQIRDDFYVPNLPRR